MWIAPGKTIANILWKTGAIKISVSEPFKMTSGKLSPVYIDCRKLISFPLEREIINTCAYWLCEHQNIRTDVIAGGETAGIPFAAWLAEKTNQPFIYVRKKPKGHGTSAQIEGILQPGQTVLLYEDLITDGLSKLKFLEGIRNSGGVVKECLVILDRQEGGNQSLKKEGVRLHALATLAECLEMGLQRQFLSTSDHEAVVSHLSRGR